MKHILLIIDVQKGFITTPAVNNVKNNIDDLISLNCFDAVISTVYQNYDNSPIIKLMGWDKLKSSEEQQLVGRAKHQSDYVINKNKYSGINKEFLTILKDINKQQEETCVYLVGVDTECCVLSTAIDLFELGIRPIVLTKYCGSSSGLNYHNAGLLCLENLIGRCNIFDDIITSKTQLDVIYSKAKENTNKKNIIDIPIEEKIVKKLIDNNWHISFAESCTGGMAVSKLISVADASKVINVSFVTYANKAKQDFLGVNETTINSYGVVSEQVALEMAIGVAKNNLAEVGVGISGIAGPGGATKAKPVGQVCFGFYINGKEYAFTKQFGDIGRNNVRELSVKFVYNKLFELF